MKEVIFGFLMCMSSTSNTPSYDYNSDVFTTMLKNHECLVEALWFEARGQPTRVQEYVMFVIDNRLKTNKGFKDYCHVIGQKYQFSYRNNLESQQRKQITLKNKIDAVEHQKIHTLVSSFIYKEKINTTPIGLQWFVSKGSSHQLGSKVVKYKISHNDLKIGLDFYYNQSF